jgi:CxxC motif-containing protein (DUF1111 family)
MRTGPSAVRALDRKTVHLYSDLLLHDMGPALGDTGSYGAFTPGSPSDEADGPVPTLAQVLESLRTEPGAANMEMKGAERLEWRTPPLWGVRDSAPYLHDGRAQNLGQAIVAHGGEAADSARLYSKLSFDEQQSVQAFLKSLVVPAAREEN